jgi:hypothetical protein
VPRMDASRLSSVASALLVPLALTSLSRADTVIVESRTGGFNFSAYSEDTLGFPNGWQTSASKSSAPGITPAIGSRFNTNSAIGGSATWFAVSPTLALMGGIYTVDVTTTSASGTLTGIVSTVTTSDGTISGTDIDTNAPGLQTAAFSAPHDGWNRVGTLTLNPGISQPTLRFEETANTNRFYADAVRFTLLPEPASFTLLALVPLLIGRGR